MLLSYTSDEYAMLCFDINRSKLFTKYLERSRDVLMIKTIKNRSNQIAYHQNIYGFPDPPMMQVDTYKILRHVRYEQTLMAEEKKASQDAEEREYAKRQADKKEREERERKWEEERSERRKRTGKTDQKNTDAKGFVPDIPTQHADGTPFTNEEKEERARDARERQAARVFSRNMVDRYEKTHEKPYEMFMKYAGHIPSNKKDARKNFKKISMYLHSDKQKDPLLIDDYKTLATEKDILGRKFDIYGESYYIGTLGSMFHSMLYANSVHKQHHRSSTFTDKRRRH